MTKVKENQANPAKASHQAAVAYLNQLAAADMHEWLKRHLAGADALLPMRGDNGSRGYAAASMYRWLSHGGREDMLSAMDALLRELPREDGLTGEAAKELLSMVQHIHSEETGYILADLAMSRAFSRLEEDVRYRILQGLIQLRVKMEPEFWLELFKENPKYYGSVAFSGLALTSMNNALNLLAVMPEDDSLIAKISMNFRGVIKHLSESGMYELSRKIASLEDANPDHKIIGSVANVFKSWERAATQSLAS